MIRIWDLVEAKIPPAEVSDHGKKVSNYFLKTPNLASLGKKYFGVEKGIPMENDTEDKSYLYICK